MATTFNWYTPKLVVKNISQKDVRVLGQLTIGPGETVDVYSALDPLEVSAETITKSLEKPWGDIYREVELKRTLEIVEVLQVDWKYSEISPTNLGIPLGLPGQVLALDDDQEFEWIDVALDADEPLVVSNGVISLPKASGSQDGYLSREDWLLFASGSAGKPDQKIWQYQDFGAPVGTSLTISAFENGDSLAFNAGYIIDGSAQIVLSSDTSSPPTTTTSIPARYLPGNRVSVSSHIGTTVVLDQAPAASLGCRVFFLISLPAAIPLPNNYQEDPEFTNEPRADYLDANFVNQNADESIFGVKTFEDTTRFNDNVGIGTAPSSSALEVSGKITTTAFQLTTGAVDGYYLRGDASGNTSWAQVAAAGISAIQVQEDGVNASSRDTLNFIGSALTAADDIINSRTNITLSQSPAGSASVVGTGRSISTAAPLTGGGDLSADRTVSIPRATAAVDGYLAATDFATFSNKLTSPLTTAGDIIVFDSTNNIRLPIGADGYVLTVDLSLPHKLKWAETTASSSDESVEEAIQRSWFGV